MAGIFQYDNYSNITTGATKILLTDKSIDNIKEYS